MTIKTLKSMWIVAYRDKRRNYVAHVLHTRKAAREVVRQSNKQHYDALAYKASVGAQVDTRKHLPPFYVARFVHRHYGQGDFTR